MEPTEPDHNVLTQEAKWRIESGFWTLKRILSQLTDTIEDQTPEMNHVEAKHQARSIITPIWEAQCQRQTTWPAGPTISDRLERGFASLEKNRKILARMNYTCCRTCARCELADDQDDDTVGYVYFHEQTTKSLVEDGTDIDLDFGSFTKSDRKNQAVGKAVVGSLRKAGLSVSWAGDVYGPIRVVCPEWRRRVDTAQSFPEDGDEDYDSDGNDFSGRVHQ